MQTPMAKSITKRTLVGFRNICVNTRFFEDLINQITNKESKLLGQLKKGQTYWKANNNNEMKFNAIVGNPPYQLSAKGGNRSKPIYNKFVDLSKNLNPDYLSLIIPSRWMAGGLGLSDFRNSMLEDKRIVELIDYPDSNEVFPGVEVKGGISYFLWNKLHDGRCKITTKRGTDVYGPKERSLDEFDILVPDSRAVVILEKILKANKIQLQQFCR